MRIKICLVALLLATALSPIQPALAQQKGDPLSGTWKGDWGPSSTDRNAVIVVLKWNGKTLTGTVNPGPDAIPIEKASFDPQSMKIHLEATKTSPNFVYVIDGVVEKDKMTGSWSRPNRKGDFQLSRDVKKKAESDGDADSPRLPGLKADEQKVVRYLLKDWGQDFSVTSVDMAMETLGLRQSDQTRFRIGKYIKDHPELHSVIRQWGWQTVALTPNEKLIARAIVNRERDKQKAPSTEDLAKSAGISEKEAKDAVQMLARLRILKREKSVGGIGYVAAETRYLNWQPWLDFQFHRVALSSGRTFNTN
jgi:predicted DNA-binding transcriptional regulator